MMKLDRFMAGAVICAVWVGALGCGGPREPRALKAVPPPPVAPAVPPVQNVQVDPQLQTSARQEIRVAFESNDEVIRANALEAAQKTLGPQARDLILRGLGDSNPLVRFAAAMAAGQIQLREAYQPLLKMVNDPDIDVRIGVRYALHRLGDKRFTKYLEETAVHQDQYVRSQTVIVLGLLGEPSAMKILRQMINDPEPIVRLQAAEAMWRLGDEQGLSALVAGSVSRFTDDQVIAILALAGPKDSRVIEHMRGKLTSDWPEIALAAARAMGELGSDEGYGVAMRALRSNDPRQRALALLAFGAIGRADAQQYVAPLLRDSDPNVRLAAATAALQISRNSMTAAQ